MNKQLQKRQNSTTKASLYSYESMLKSQSQIPSAICTPRQDDSSFSEDDMEDDCALQKEQEFKSRLIRITRPMRIRWDIFTMILALWNALWVPIDISFVKSGELFEFGMITSTIIDSFFILDLILNFFTTYIDKSQEEIFDHKKIVNHYLRTWFIFDLIASFPIDKFMMVFGDKNLGGNDYISLTDVFKVVRIVRLNRIIRVSALTDYVKSTIRLLATTIYLLLFVHFTACIWWIVVTIDNNWVPVPDWTDGTTTIFEESKWTQYLVCIYHAVWFVVGGELGVRNTKQAWVASWLMIFGAMMSAVLFGQIAVLMQNLSRSQTEFQLLLDGAMTVMNDMDLSDELRRDILNFITTNYKTLNSQEESEAFAKHITPSLQRQVNEHVLIPAIASNPVFKGNKAVNEFIKEKIHQIFYKPEDKIIKEGSVPEWMYFIAMGECEVIVLDTQQEFRHVKMLYPGSYFGELGLFYGILRTSTIKTTSYCTVCEVPSETFDTMINKFPELKRQFRDIASQYIDPWKSFILDMLSSIDYLVEDLSANCFNELPYLLTQERYEWDDYLFRPGDIPRGIYLIAEGSVELSGCINSRQINAKRQRLAVPSLSNSQAKVIFSHQRVRSTTIIPSVNQQESLPDDKFQLGIFILDRLKPHPGLSPMLFNGSVIGFKKPDEKAQQKKGDSIGNYIQEIIFQDLKPGSVILPKLGLLDEPLWVTAKWTEPTTVYILEEHVIQQLRRENYLFDQHIKDRRDRMYKHDNSRNQQIMRGPIVDYISPNERAAVTKWKNAIMRVICNNRFHIKTRNCEFENMIDRWEAIVAWEEAGNLELAGMVASGIVAPYEINDDGTYEPEKTELQNRRLPKKHPVIRKVSKCIAEIEKRECVGQVLEARSQKIGKIKHEMKMINKLLSKVPKLPKLIPQTGAAKQSDIETNAEILGVEEACGKTVRFQLSEGRAKKRKQRFIARIIKKKLNKSF